MSEGQRRVPRGLYRRVPCGNSACDAKLDVFFRTRPRYGEQIAAGIRASGWLCEDPEKFSDGLRAWCSAECEEADVPPEVPESLEGVMDPDDQEDD